jgi:hypothetical protein
MKPLLPCTHPNAAAPMLGYGHTKTKHLVLTGQIRSVKDGGNRRILSEWVQEYVRNRAEQLSA